MPRGRTALGAAAKDKTGSVRVTQHDYDYFEKRYGGLGNFLKAKVNEELRKRNEMEEAKTS